MTSPVVVSNLALSHLGDQANVASISPPDGSRQAALCALYYPYARDALLEARDWTFATRRVTLADLDDPVGVWLYRYAYPSSCFRISKVLGASSDDHEPTEPFTVETISTGERTILTDVEEATAVYIHKVTDLTKFTVGAITALSYILASYVAGPLIKGEEGAMMADRMFKQYLLLLGAAGTADAAQHRPKKGYVPSSIEARQ